MLGAYLAPIFMEKKMGSLVSDNFNFYKKEILPFNFIVYTSKGEIIITPQKSNLKHLLGIGKSINATYANMPAKKFFDKMDAKTNPISLFEFIDEERYINGGLYLDEVHILNKNLYFQDIFEEFFSSPNLFYFIKKKENLFDADYIHFCYVEKAGGYIGIKGDDKTNYHFFNSIIYEPEIPKKYKGTKIIVYKIERIKKESFCVDNYNVVCSNRFEKSKIKKNISKKEITKIDYKKIEKKINALLKSDLYISVGMYGKNSIQLYKRKKRIETNLTLSKELNTPQKIAKYINETYK